jgi:uncharacterized FlgJ-related protein
MSTSYRVDWKPALLVSLSLNIIMGCVMVYMANIPSRINHVYHSVVSNKVSDISLDDSSVAHEMVCAGIILPSVAIAQAKLESSMGKSRLGREAKNLFGIKYHRCEHVSGNDGEYAKYERYADCIRCYAHIQNRYLKNIDGSYAEAGNYVENIRKFKK